VRIGTERKSDQTKNVNQKTDLCELDRDLRQDTDRQDIMQDGQQMNTKSKYEGKKETVPAQDNRDRTVGEYGQDKITKMNYREECADHKTRNETDKTAVR